MSKNMTRKGLAVGSALALVASGFASAPAYAAPGINLDDVNEVGLYSMIEGGTFEMLAAGNADFNTNNQTRLRVKITNVNGSDNVPTLSVQGTAPDAINYATNGATDTALGTTAGDDGVFADSTAAMATPFKLTIKAGAMSAGDVEKYTVQVWDDADNDGNIDSDEYASPVRTVTFIESADVVVNHVIDAVTEGDGQISGSFSIAGVDTEQLTITDFSVHLTSGLDAELAYDTDAAAGGGGAGAVPLVLAGAAGAAANSKMWYDSTNNVLKWKTAAAADATVDTAGANGTALKVVAAKSTAVKAQALYKSGGSEAVADTLGSDAYRSVVALSLATLTADTTDSTTAESSGDTFNNTDGTTFGVEAKAVDSSGDAVAGIAVTAKVEVPTGALGAADNQLTINGVTYTDEAKLPGATGIDELSLTTDAAGMVYVTMTASDFAAADTVKVTFTSQNVTANQIVAAAAPTYKAYVANHDEKVVITSGGTATLAIEVYDQFGGALPSGYDARVLFQSTANFTAAGETASTAAADVNAGVTNGKVTIAITPDGVGTGTTNYDIDIQKRQAGGAFAAKVASVDALVIESVSALTVPDTISVTIGTAAYGDDATTDAIEITDADGAGAGTVGQALELADFVTFANRAVVGATEPTLNATLSLAGTLKKAATATAAAVNAADQLVTFTANSNLVQFVAKVDQNSDNADEKIYGVGSVQTWTDANGAFDVDVASNVAGKYTVTITSGGVSQDVIISVEGAAVGTAASVVITAPEYSPAGSTVIAKAVVTDKYGNPVKIADNAAADFELTYSGPGLAVTARADTTDADGEAQVAYFLGSNDSGTITITAKYDKTDNGVYTDTGDLVVTKTITIGDAPAPVADTKVNAGSFKGYVAIYAKGHAGKRLSAKVGKDWVVVPALASNFVRVVEYTGAGYTISVRIYIDRVLVDTIVVTTK